MEQCRYGILKTSHPDSLSRAGTARSRDLVVAGVTRSQLSRMVVTGELVRVARGLYAKPGYQSSEHGVWRRSPSARQRALLPAHGATTSRSNNAGAFEVWIAIGNKEHPPRLTYPTCERCVSPRPPSGSARACRWLSTPGASFEHPAMENPTLVFLTDRNDLDDQLFGTFAALPRNPAADAGAGGRPAEPLRELLNVAAAAWFSRRFRSSMPGGERRQASASLGAAQHRRHRRRSAPQPIRLHRRLRAPHARRAAERVVHRLHRHADREDRRQHAAVFGDYISIYDIQRAVDRQGDGADLLREPRREAGA